MLSKIKFYLFASSILITALFIFSIFLISQNIHITIFFAACFIFLIYLNWYILKLINNLEILNKYSEPQKTISSEPFSSTLEDKLKYDALLSSIGEGLIVTDKNGVIITFNKSAENLLGWTNEEALGKKFSDIIKIDFNEKPVSGNYISGNPTQTYFLRKNKSKFPANITDTSYIQGSNVLGTITLIRDITSELYYEQMKNDFISMASHQLRTPLSVIKWYSQMLIIGDAGQLLPGQIEYMKNINTATERMIKLVNSLLNISRIESGKLKIEPVPTDLKKLAEEIIEDLKIRYAYKNQKLNAEIENSIPLINIDPQLIRQVYTNLLTNALKYSQEKGTISLKIYIKDDFAYSEIKDDGYGIPENEKDKVFNKFYRGSNISHLVTEGTGLGLYLIKSIIEISNGKIWFDSKAGSGTTFYFTLPLSGIQPRKGTVSLSI